MTSPVTFFAPSLVFLAPKTFAFRGPAEVAEPLRNAADEVVRLAAGLLEALAAFARGEGARAMPFPLELLERNGDGVRPAAGVAVREIGGVGRLIEGLSQEEKKSSSGSPAGVEDPSVGPLLITSVMTTSFGYLYTVRSSLVGKVRNLTQQRLLQIAFSTHPCIW